MCVCVGGGGGCKTKNLPWGEYAYFLELYIAPRAKVYQLQVISRFDSVDEIPKCDIIIQY